MISILLKPGIGWGYLHILCSVDMCVNIYEIKVIYTYTHIAETYKLMSNVSLRKICGLHFLFCKKRFRLVKCNVSYGLKIL